GRCARARMEHDLHLAHYCYVYGQGVVCGRVRAATGLEGRSDSESAKKAPEEPDERIARRRIRPAGQEYGVAGYCLRGIPLDHVEDDAADIRIELAEREVRDI